MESQQPMPPTPSDLNTVQPASPTGATVASPPSVPPQPSPLPQPTGEATPPESPQSASLWHKMLLFLVGFIVLAGVAAGSYYFGMQRSASVLPLSPTIAPTRPVMPTSRPTPVASTSANWQTYTKGNFSIKYPATFYLDSTGRGADYIFDSKNTMDLYFAGTNIPKLNTNQLAISFLSSVDSSHGSLQALANLRQAALSPNAPYTKVTVGGIDGIKIFTNNNSIEEYAFPTSSGDISITAQPADSSLMPLFEQMIQTLHITQ